MSGPLRRAWGLRRDPILTDRRYDIASILTWFFYGAWGLLTALSDITVFRNLTAAYAELWGGTIGLSTMIAAGAGAALFFLHPSSYESRIRAKRVEVFALCIMIGLLTVYPTVLVAMAVGAVQGEPRYDILALSFSYFPFAVFRVQHLLGRIRQLYKYTDGQDGG